MAGSLRYAGARNGLTTVRNGQASTYHGSLLPVGGSIIKKGKPIEREFEVHEISVDADTWVFMYTDGLLEQIGGTDGLPFNYQPFEALLVAVAALPTNEQRNRLVAETMNNWRGSYPRTDDVLLLGFRMGAAGSKQ